MSELAVGQHLKVRECAARLNSPSGHRRKAGQGMVADALWEERLGPGVDAGHSGATEQPAETGDKVTAVLGLGLITVWEGAEAALARAGMRASDLLDRHRHGDWGHVRDVDRVANLEGLREGHGVVSGYILPTGSACW